MIAVAKKPVTGGGGEKRDSRPGRKSAPVQIDKELARMAAVIAANDEVTLSDLLSPVVRQFIMTNYERVQREISERIKRMRDEAQ